jgi:hypothetical protein
MRKYVLPFTVAVCLMYFYVSEANDTHVQIVFEHTWPSSDGIENFTMPSVEFDGKKIEVEWAYKLMSTGGRRLESERIEARRGQHVIRLDGDIVRSVQGRSPERYRALNPDGNTTACKLKVPRKETIITYSIEPSAQAQSGAGMMESALELHLEEHHAEPEEP